jgi:hypothetical protein
METAPQAVTERYVSNLLHHGRNKEFDIVSIDRLEHMVQGTLVGYFWEVGIAPANSNEGRTGFGASIGQAVRDSLLKNGVTFR